MNWDQIQVKWAAMARRVRSDLPEMAQGGPNGDPPAPAPGDLPEPPLAELAALDAG